MTRLVLASGSGARRTLLANAGLRRLGMADIITDLMDPEFFLPAPGQGATPDGKLWVSAVKMTS